MSFLSLYFWLFLFLLLYFFHTLRNKKFKVILLSCASSLFYIAFSLKFFLLLLALIVLSFFLGSTLAIKRFPYLSILLVCIPFLSFKLIPLFNELSLFPSLEVFLPLGLSFYTFQICAYLLDVYRDKVIPLKSFSEYFLFISFFPQLVAGPIERSENMIPQFKFERKVKKNDFYVGFMYILQGFFKKILIANWLIVIVDPVFFNPKIFSGLSIIVAVYLVRFYIYYDFSGYSDLAIGISRLFGIELLNNFNRPFSARSLSDFWRRWHISLSSWVRDYIFYPLVISRINFIGVGLITVLTFVILGLWHSFSLNLIIYGLLQGLIITLANKTKKMRLFVLRKLKIKNKNFISAYQTFFTFFLWIGIPTIFFKAKSFNDALYILREFIPNGSFEFYNLKIFENMSTSNLFLLLFGMLFFEFFQWKKDVITSTLNKESIMHYSLKIILFSLIILLIVLFGRLEDQSNFLYFSF
jgi:alginate O-acetyltransferase complex protein AlgI